MAANDDMPRGPDLVTNVGSNTTPTINLPAVPGCAWVVTAVNLLVWGASAADEETVTLNGTQYPAAAISGSAAAGWTGKAQFGTDTAVTISTTGSGSVNRFCDLEAQVYLV